MTMASMTNFLHQLALAPLYGLMATQKSYVCSTNSLLAATTGMSVMVGDASTQQASGIAAGKCMSQYYTTNAQEPGASTGAGVLQTLTTAVTTIQLDALIHPLDAAMTWMLGCVSGLQDIVQTVNRAR